MQFSAFKMEVFTKFKDLYCNIWQMYVTNYMFLLPSNKNKLKTLFNFNNMQ